MKSDIRESNRISVNGSVFMYGNINMTTSSTEEQTIVECMRWDDSGA